MRCPVCNGPVDAILLYDGERVGDCCSRCSMRGYGSFAVREPLERKDYGEPDSIPEMQCDYDEIEDEDGANEPGV